jgi:hypothetical protein
MQPGAPPPTTSPPPLTPPPPYAMPPAGAAPADAAPAGGRPDERLKWAKICGIAGGVVLIVSGVLMGLLFGVVAAAIGLSGAVADDPGAGIAAAIFAAVALFMTLGSILLGILVLLGSLRYERENAKGWAIAVLVCGGIALFTGAGFFFGAALAIASGVLALLVLTGK